jgi:hypothetical protein
MDEKEIRGVQIFRIGPTFGIDDRIMDTFRNVRRITIETR